LCPHFLCERTIHGNAVDFGVQVLVAVPVLADVAHLFGADAGSHCREEKKDDVLSRKVAQRHYLYSFRRFVQQGKVRHLISNLYCHASTPYDDVMKVEYLPTVNVVSPKDVRSLHELEKFYRLDEPGP